jgi:hypothetical protein
MKETLDGADNSADAAAGRAKAPEAVAKRNPR